MAQIYNLNDTYVPIRERRRTTGTLAALKAEVVHQLNGDEAAKIYINAAVGTWNATLEFTGTVDGTNYFPIPVFPDALACTGGTIPISAQPLLIEAINTTSVIRTYSVSTGQLAAIRVRASVFTAGSADVTIISDPENSSHPHASGANRNATLAVTATGAASAAVTATLPLVAGLRHYIDFIQVIRSATAALTASATPAITAYKAGQKFRMLTGTASTGTNVTAHTLNVNGLGAKSIKTSQGAIDPTIGDWLVGSLLELVYDGTTFRIDNAAGAWASWSPTLNVAGGGTSGVSFVATYQKYSRICHVQCVCTWTQTTIPASYVAITLPIVAYYNNQTLTTVGWVGANISAGIGLTGSSGTVVNIYNYNLGTFGVGVNQVIFGGTYMTI